jgi:hypothetical protein
MINTANIPSLLKEKSTSPEELRRGGSAKNKGIFRNGNPKKDRRGNRSPAEILARFKA